MRFFLGVLFIPLFVVCSIFHFSAVASEQKGTFLENSSRDLTRFHERFEIVLNNKNERVIVDKTIRNHITIENYIRYLAPYLKSDEGDYIKQRTYECKGSLYAEPKKNMVDGIGKLFDFLKKSNFGSVIEQDNFVQFLEKIEDIVEPFIQDESYAIVANLDNPSFFYDQTLIKLFKKSLNDFVKGYVDVVPHLKLMSFVASDYLNMIEKNKQYHQGILYSYLESYEPSLLGLTESDKNRALSSLEDAKLSPLKGFFKTNKIKNNFESYGQNALKKAQLGSEKKWEKHADLFDSRESVFNHAFYEVVYEGAPITINLNDNKSRINKEPSMTLDMECPNFNYQLRQSYEFARIVLGVLPVPYSGKLFSLIKSKYQSQAMSESIFYGYLEFTGQLEKAEIIKKQSMNPLF